jgi:dihydrofolate synthase/folylpolyglutamate synthase
MVAMIVPIADCIIVTKSLSPRAYDPVLLKEQIITFDPSKEVVVTNSVPEAINHARRHARRKDLICISGSLFTVGEARKYLLHH